MCYYTEKIANRIKKCARERSVTLQKMLSDLGFGINLISQLAHGHEISSINLAKIADYLGCSVDYLLGRTDNPKINH